MDARLQSAPLPTAGHSAVVKIFLHINGGIIPLSHAGEHSVKAADRIALPAGTGEIEVVVDGHSYFRKAVLLTGSLPGEWAELD